MTLTCKRGFTLIELLVVVGMIGIIAGALTTSVSSAQHRARVQKATADVKVISQAILAFENWSQNGKYKLPEYDNPVEAGADTLDFLLGAKQADSEGNIPAMLMAQLKSGNKIRDPWGHPYWVRIRRKAISAVKRPTISTGYYLPNFYRVKEEEK